MSETQNDELTLDAIGEMRAVFFEKCKQLAEKNKVPGIIVLDLLKEVSEEICEAGLDSAFGELSPTSRDRLMNAFDFTWLALLAVRLNTWRPN